MRFFKECINNILLSMGFAVRRIKPNKISTYSSLEEEVIIKKYLKHLKDGNNFFVDIGAGDGIRKSNTYSLTVEGWQGLSIEYNADEFSKLAYSYKKYPDIKLSKSKVTPENIVNILKANDVPKEFNFLSLDIDGYDFYVLYEILKKYRPKLICSEINEKIPPPIKFTVKWDPNYSWNEDHFMGYSISQLEELCKNYNYGIVELHYNNVFLMPIELCKKTLSPEEAFSNGYLNKKDRKKLFYYNADMEELLEISPEKGIEFINKKFKIYKDQYICKL